MKSSPFTRVDEGFAAAARAVMSLSISEVDGASRFDALEELQQLRAKLIAQIKACQESR